MALFEFETHKSFGGLRLSGSEFFLGPQNRRVIVPNGAGKRPYFNLLRMMKPDRKIRVDHQETHPLLTNMRRGIPEPFNWSGVNRLTALENFMAGSSLRSMPAYHIKHKLVPEAEQFWS